MNIKLSDFTDEIKNNYITYAEYVIRDRAIPDIRDGLKPVHRRILWEMWNSGCRSNTYYKKSARVVGGIMAKYHPHGDNSIYASLVRLAQPFSLNDPLIDGKGNFGSIDSNSFAASRYTECRLSKFSEDVYFSDIDEDVVDFIKNYDGNEKEPVILPSVIPMILCTSSSGIAVGMATDIPPHNLKEVCDVTMMRIKGEKEIDRCFCGPDFPLGGFIKIDNEIYKNGKGSCQYRSKVISEKVKRKKQLIIKSLPYSTYKEDVINDIAKAFKNEKIVGIKDIRDESDREGIRICIDLEGKANEKEVVESIYKSTKLQLNVSVNLVSIINGQPKVVGLYDILDAFIVFRQECIYRRTKYRLEKFKSKKELLEAIIAVADEPKKLLSILVKANKNMEIVGGIQNKFKLNKRQAEYIAEMPVKKLSNVDKAKNMKEKDELEQEIKKQENVISDSDLINEIMLQEISGIKDKYGRERVTKVYKT